MSRIGKLPINIPSGVEVSVQDNLVNVTGPNGKLKKHFSKLAQIVVQDNVITVTPSDDTRPARAMYGTARSIMSICGYGVC
ncbi:MAG: 50S ribosomal protein L6, partial [Verrucomicrobia bacterium]|nr:50S ribosomal protein L6 [Verrucomicrobiota bacterium]